MVNLKEVLGFLPTPLALSPAVQKLLMPFATHFVPMALPGVLEAGRGNHKCKSMEAADEQNA